MRFLIFLYPIITAAFPLVPTLPNLWAQEPNPQEVQILGANFSGNGCPEGSVSTSISDDRAVMIILAQNIYTHAYNIVSPLRLFPFALLCLISMLTPRVKAITFGFGKFQAYIGPGYSATDKTKSCQLSLGLKYPSGFQFAVVDSTYHGYAQLDKGVTGTFYSTYSFNPDNKNATITQTSISGGDAWADGQVYTKEDTVPITGYIFSPCSANGILVISNRISLTSSDSAATGVLTDDDATAFTQQVNLDWRTCELVRAEGG